MKVEVMYKKIWGKDLYYPISAHAIWLTKFLGKTAMQMKHLKMCKEIDLEIIIKAPTDDFDL